MEALGIGSDWTGQVVDGKFTLIERVGATARSAVFRTELREGPRVQPAAIKIIPAEAAEADALLASWSAALRLSHPHLMPVFRTGRCQMGESTQVYVVTEHADEVLSQLLPDRAMTPDEAKEMLGPIVDALIYLHASGFVHGHLKPSNILVVSDQLKISGDGLRLAGRHRKSLSTLDEYDAPELAGSAATAAADMWSLGVTLVEALTREVMVVDRSRSEDPTIPVSIPEPFAEIARNCLRRSPARRWRAEEVKARLEGRSLSAVGASAEKQARPAAGTTDVKKDGGKRRIAVIAAAAVVIVSAAVLLRPHRHADEKVSPAGPSVSTPNAAQPTTAAQDTADAPTKSKPPAATPAAPQAEATNKAAQPGSTEGASSPAASSAPPPAAADTTSGSVKKGEVAQRVLPDVPEKAMQTINGKFGLAIKVTADAQGAVTNATLTTPGPSRYFASLAMEAARKWKFKPAQAGGQTVASEWTLQFEFRPGGIEVSAEEEAP